jgi:addiction module RelB/DinJ family antitoxin
MTEQVRYRIEQRLVREAEKVCDELGLSPSQVVSMTFAQLVRLRALPFRPSEFPALEEYGATLAEADAAERRALREIDRDRRAGKVVRFTEEINTPR